MSGMRRSLSWRRPAWLPSLNLLATLCVGLYSSVAYAQTKAAAEYFVTELPGAPLPLLKMWAGHIEVTPEHHGNLFFWLFKNRHIANRQRTVLWINGGPGCSSLDGALMEIGPYRVNENGTLRLNDGSWDEFANVVFVDNPVGTGFSYVDSNAYVTELDQMADQMVVFLEKFFDLFPEMANDDLYVAGESYAGQHIPYIAKAILDRNKRHSGPSQWNIAGLLIGNGWISGPEQYMSYLPAAYEQGVIERGSSADTTVLRQQELCTTALEQGGSERVDIGQCDAILRVILSESKRDNKCVNMYDTRLRDSFPSCGMNWPPDLAQMTPYLRRDDVTHALHINPDKKTGWTECNSQVSSYFRARKSRPSKELLPELLSNMAIMLFSGDRDLICNHIGTENIIKQLTWGGATGMETSPGMTAPMRHWTVDGEPAGLWQTARNLTYVRLYNASHMVPFDYPRRTRDMLDRFMKVDIASVGGTPTESKLDGESGPLTAVGSHPNSTAAKVAEEDKLQAATWAAYRRSAEAALVVVVLAASLWAFFIWHSRRRRQGYRGIFGSDPYDSFPGGGLGLDGASLRSRQSKENRDIEAAADFDEAELDDLSYTNGHDKHTDRDHFTLDEEDEDEEDYNESSH